MNATKKLSAANFYSALEAVGEWGAAEDKSDFADGELLVLRGDDGQPNARQWEEIEDTAEAVGGRLDVVEDGDVYICPKGANRHL